MKRSTCRVTAMIAAALILSGTWLLYKGDFWSLRTEEQRLDAIVAYASKKPDSHIGVILHPDLLFDETIEGRRILVFTDREINGLLGSIQFRRGILGGWQPLCASYCAGQAMQSTVIQDRDIRVLYAADCPPEIASYKMQANLDNDDTLMAEGLVDSTKFFHIHKTDRDLFPDLHLYDADGNELNSVDYQAIDQSISSPSISSAETNFVYVLCAFLLGVGWIIVKYLWDSGTSQNSPPEKEKRTA